MSLVELDVCPFKLINKEQLEQDKWINGDIICSVALTVQTIRLRCAQKKKSSIENSELVQWVTNCFRKRTFMVEVEMARHT